MADNIRRGHACDSTPTLDVGAEVGADVDVQSTFASDLQEEAEKPRILPTPARSVPQKQAVGDKDSYGFGRGRFRWIS